jgi:transposase-like protein
MDFPLLDLLDAEACYARLLALLHPTGLACPRCGGRDGWRVHRRHRSPVLDYRCGPCGRVFNAYTGTVLARSQKQPGQVLLLLRGMAQGVSTARLARELGLDRPKLLAWRHRLQALAERATPRGPLPAAVAEADELYQNAGEKRVPAPGPRRPAPAAGQ